MCFNELNYPLPNTFPTVLLTNRGKIHLQEFDSEFVFVHEGKEKNFLLKNPILSTQHVRLVASFIYYSNRVFL
jgi:hypothetical protein